MALDGSLVVRHVAAVRVAKWPAVVPVPVALAVHAGAESLSIFPAVVPAPVAELSVAVVEASLCVVPVPADAVVVCVHLAIVEAVTVVDALRPLSVAKREVEVFLVAALVLSVQDVLAVLRRAEDIGDVVLVFVIVPPCHHVPLRMLED